MYCSIFTRLLYALIKFVQNVHYANRKTVNTVLSSFPVICSQPPDSSNLFFKFQFNFHISHVTQLVSLKHCLSRIHLSKLDNKICDKTLCLLIVVCLKISFRV